MAFMVKETTDTRIEFLRSAAADVLRHLRGFFIMH